MRQYFLVSGGIMVLVFFVIFSVSFIIRPVTGHKEQEESSFQTVSKLDTPEEERKQEVKDVSILFLGDMMFDRYIRETADRKGYNFLLDDEVGVLQKSDIAVGNLEGPITENLSQSSGSVVGSADNYTFTFDPEVARFLSMKNIRIVNIGNNHITNFGKEGLKSTEEFLAQESVQYFGAIGKDAEKDSIAFTLSGVRISLINYNEFSRVPLSVTLEHIQKERKKSDSVIVYTHWGIEYEKYSSESQQEKAHQFIDAGADVVFGSHPHVIEEKEIYQGKAIYYSLGNAIFDQYFSLETKQGLAVQMSIDTKTKEISFQEFPLVLNSTGQTVITK